MTAMQRRPELRTRPWNGDGMGGLAVYDPATDQGFLLNASTAAVFRACDGSTDRAAMAESVAELTGLPADEGIVDLALDELASSGLIAAIESEGADRSAVEPTGLSRRRVIARLALGAGAVALLPMVDVVAGASKLAAESPGADPQVVIPDLVAQDKSASTQQDTPVDVTFSTTGGYTTPDSTAYMVQSDPAHGSVSVVGAVATYTPAPGFVGTDTFTYIAWQCVAFVDAVLACPDGTGPFPESGSDPATVTVEVLAEQTTTTSSIAGSSTTSTAQQVAPATVQPRFTG